jgi:acetyl esterase/lipase
MSSTVRKQVLVRRASLALALGAAAGAAALAWPAGLSAQQTGPAVQTTDPMQIRPEGPAPQWAPNIDPQMQAVIEQLTAFGAPPLPELRPDQARKAKTPTDAVQALLRKTGMPPMQPAVDIDHRVIPGSAPQGVLLRTYTPRQGSGPFPVIVYYHGGGWVIAGPDTYEPSARALAEKAGAVVVSVAYRQAPENKFPAAHEDAFAAYRWVTENATQINGDPNRIALVGESAGGNLAVATAMQAREQGVRLPVHIVSVYPIADGDTESPSYQQYADAAPLSRPAMQWFFEQYLRGPQDARDPRISLVNANLSGLPPTTIINAQIDPLQSEGEQLAERMRQAGVQVEQRTWQGVTHEFFGMAAVLEQAEEAQQMAVSRLRQAFAGGARAQAQPMQRPAQQQMQPQTQAQAQPQARRMRVRKDP